MIVLCYVWLVVGMVVSGMTLRMLIISEFGFVRVLTFEFVRTS